MPACGGYRDWHPMLGVLSADDPGGPDAFVGPGGWHADVGDHHVGKFAVHCPEESVLKRFAEYPAIPDLSEPSVGWAPCGQ
jgi:hypothetical protein